MNATTYAVTLAHDQGTVTLQVMAAHPDSAADIAADIEHAPLSTVLSVTPMS